MQNANLSEWVTVSGLRVAVIVASCGRPTELGQLRRSLAEQTRPPDKIIFSVTDGLDLPDADQMSGVDVLLGPKGSCVQRNRALDRLDGRADIIVFLDDDYLPSRGMIEGVCRSFRKFPDVVGMNGEMLLDGINSPGIGLAAALATLADYDARPTLDPTVKRELDGLYGCNMAFRANAIGSTRFDERLPLYGWQEDIDFAARLLSTGRLVMTDGFAGVHRGVKAGRTSGLRFGYSQIANPLYLVKKGTMRRAYALKIIRNNILANHLRFLTPEPWVDRRGRARGNWIALRDVALGRDDPRRILELDR